MSRLPDYRRAERLAYRVLADRRITTLPVEPLSLLRACRDTEVMTCAEAAEYLRLPELHFERLFDRTEAVTFRCERDGAVRFCVVYQPGGNPARLRFTLAHELGHRLMNHYGVEAAEEREADHFASHLLCPEPALALLRDRAGELPLQQIASTFYVSMACAKAASQRMPPMTDHALLCQVEGQLSAAMASVEVDDRRIL